MQSRFLVLVLFILTIVATASVTLLVGGKQAGISLGASTDGGAAVSEDAVGELVRDYIVNNPEEIVNAFLAARQKQEQQAAQEAEKNIVAKLDDIENSPNSPEFGNTDGDVVFVKFNDYNCGFCKRVAPDVDKLLASDKNIKFVVKEFPILGAQSTKLAKAALAFNALSPAQYGEFHKNLLKATPRTDAQIKAAAEKLGVSGDELLAKMESDEVQQEINASLQLGQSIGVSGTPAFVIGGEFIRGAVGVDQMRAAIKRARDAS